MNSDSIYKIFTNDADQTKALGANIGRQLRGGEVLELVGDVGVGKTTLMHGLLAAMGFDGLVPSPTYTISRVYPVSNNIEVHHFDFYRLSGMDVVVNELAEVLDEPSAIVAVEWAGNIDHVLPYERLRISFQPGVHYSDREIVVEAMGEKYKAIIQALR